MWFKDLAASKPLNSLSKKVLTFVTVIPSPQAVIARISLLTFVRVFQAPNFNKKEEVFMLLCEYQVPVIRATWFIKLSSAYAVTVSEQKIKKRQQLDPTQGLIRYF